MGDAARMHHHANRTAAALLFILSLVPLQVNCTCTSRPIDSYVGHNNSRCRQHHPAVTTTTDGVDQQQTPSISIPSGHFEPIDLAPFDLGSPHRNLSTAEMDHVLDHPFWLACLHRVLDVQLPHKHTTAHDITLVTHTTISRLHQVGQQCAAWPGSLVVAVYVPLSHDGIHVAPREGTTLHAQLSQLAARAATIHGRGSCALRLVAYTERLPPDAHTDPLRHVYQYPINAMRNRALLAARTDLVMLVDGDLVPGPRWFLESIMHQADNGYIAALAAQCRARRAVAVVLPFELDSDATRRAQVPCVWCIFVCGTFLCGVLCEVMRFYATPPCVVVGTPKPTPPRTCTQEALASKQHIRFLWRRGDVRLFYPDFHANTDAQRWAEMDAPYAVPYVQGNGSTASFVCGVLGWVQRRGYVKQEGMA